MNENASDVSVNYWNLPKLLYYYICLFILTTFADLKRECNIKA